MIKAGKCNIEGLTRLCYSQSGLWDLERFASSRLSYLTTCYTESALAEYLRRFKRKSPDLTQQNNEEIEIRAEATSDIKYSALQRCESKHSHPDTLL